MRDEASTEKVRDMKPSKTAATSLNCIAELLSSDTKTKQSWQMLCLNLAFLGYDSSNLNQRKCQ